MNLCKDSALFNIKKSHLLLMPAPTNILLLHNSRKDKNLMTGRHEHYLDIEMKIWWRATTPFTCYHFGKLHKIFQWFRKTSSLITREYNALTAKGYLQYRAQFLLIATLTMSNRKKQVTEIIFIFRDVAWSYKHSTMHPSICKTYP